MEERYFSDAARLWTDAAEGPTVPEPRPPLEPEASRLRGELGDIFATIRAADQRRRQINERLIELARAGRS